MSRPRGSGRRWRARTRSSSRPDPGGDWPLAASLVIDNLAIGQILEPHGGQPLAREFAGMPPGQAWTWPQPHLICAALALSDGQHGSCATALDAADRILERVRADQQAGCRLAAAMIRLAASLRSGDVTAAATAAARAEVLLSQVPDDKLDRHPDIRTRVVCGRGAVELWSGHFDETARVLQAVTVGQAGSVSQGEPAHCRGQLALAEAPRGQLGRAVKLAAPAVGSPRPPVAGPCPAALVALAWVHLQRYELREAGSRLRQADAALRAGPDTLIEAVAHLVAACGAMAEGRAAVALQIIARARSGSRVPAWLDHRLILVQSRAHLAAGDTAAALAAAGQAGGEDWLEAAVTLAHAQAAAGHGDHGRRVLAPVLAAGSRAPDRVRAQAWLADARLSHGSGDHSRSRRSLASALRLAEPEQLRLPFAMERGWLRPVLRGDPELAGIHRRLLASALHRAQLPAPADTPDQAEISAVKPLSGRELEVLRHVSGLLSYAEVASEMYITVNTVKTHVKKINRKLATTRSSEAVRRARQLGLI